MVDITNFKQWTVCHLSFFMTFVLSGIVINIVQLCLFILIGWWHRSLFRKLNYYLVWMIYSQVCFLSVSINCLLHKVYIVWEGHVFFQIAHFRFDRLNFALDFEIRVGWSVCAIFKCVSLCNHFVQKWFKTS